MRDYWCLFCGKNAKRFKTPEELFEHMKIPHRDKNGGMFIHKEANTDEVIDIG